MDRASRGSLRHTVFVVLSRDTYRWNKRMQGDVIGDTGRHALDGFVGARWVTCLKVRRELSLVCGLLLSCERSMWVNGVHASG